MFGNGFNTQSSKTTTIAQTGSTFVPSTPSVAALNIALGTPPVTQPVSVMCTGSQFVPAPNIISAPPAPVTFRGPTVIPTPRHTYLHQTPSLEVPKTITKHRQPERQYSQQQYGQPTTPYMTGNSSGKLHGKPNVRYRPY